MKTLFSILTIATILISCAPVHVDTTKMPANPTYCRTKWDCKVGYHCGFPGLDTAAVCLPNSANWTR